MAKLTFGAASGSIYQLYVGLPGPRIPVPGLGDVWLDIQVFVRIATGVMGATEIVTLTRNVPNLPNLAGIDLYLQGILADPSGPSPRYGLTNGLYVRIEQ